MRFFRFFEDLRFFLFQIIISKCVGFHLKVTKTQFWTGGVGGQTFVACSRSFHAELSLVPEKGYPPVSIARIDLWGQIKSSLDLYVALFD